MPFSPATPFSFSAISVLEHAPALPGVYGILSAAEWMYIGETGNIRESLMGHLRQTPAAPVSRQPNRFVFEVCDPTRRADRQDRLILEYEPVCNRHWSRYRWIVGWERTETRWELSCGTRLCSSFSRDSAK